MCSPPQVLHSAGVLRGQRPGLLPEAAQADVGEGGPLHHHADGQRPQVPQRDPPTHHSLRPQTWWVHTADRTDTRMAAVTQQY